MSTAHGIFFGDCASRSPTATTPWAKSLTALLFLVSSLSLQGCFLTARVWKEDHPNGIREAKIECMPVSAARNGTELIVTVRIISTMETRGQQEFSHGKDTGYTDRNFTAGDLVFLNQFRSGRAFLMIGCGKRQPLSCSRYVSGGRAKNGKEACKMELTRNILWRCSAANFAWLISSSLMSKRFAHWANNPHGWVAHCAR